MAPSSFNPARGGIKESDWKRFKPLRQLALERFCEKVLLDIGRIGAEAGKSRHERYLDIYRLIHEKDKELVRTFDSLRRSTALVQLGLFRSHGLITEEELSGFSEELRVQVEVFSIAPESKPK